MSIDLCPDRPASKDAVDEWAQLVGIPSEVPTASPAEVADPSSEHGQAATAAARLYFVDLAPRAAHNSANSQDSSAGALGRPRSLSHRCPDLACAMPSSV